MRTYKRLIFSQLIEDVIENSFIKIRETVTVFVEVRFD